MKTSNDADTTGVVIAALAGAAYGIDAIRLRWREAMQGEWPLGSGTRWRATDLIALADRLTRIDIHAPEVPNNSKGE